MYQLIHFCIEVYLYLDISTERNFAYFPLK